MNPFTRNVIAVIKQIPPGRVTSYGTVAALAGNPRGTRGVTWILHSQSNKHSLPWHRVVRKDGVIAPRPGSEEQAALLAGEGIRVSGGRINMEKYGWP